jgi:hypothetical protein
MEHLKQLHAVYPAVSIQLAGVEERAKRPKRVEPVAHKQQQCKRPPEDLLVLLLHTWCAPLKRDPDCQRTKWFVMTVRWCERTERRKM